MAGNPDNSALLHASIRSGRPNSCRCGKGRELGQAGAGVDHGRHNAGYQQHCAVERHNAEYPFTIGGPPGAALLDNSSPIIYWSSDQRRRRLGGSRDLYIGLPSPFCRSGPARIQVNPARRNSAADFTKIFVKSNGFPQTSMRAYRLDYGWCSGASPLPTRI